MRDLVVFVGLMALIPASGARPIYSICLWAWFSLMAPHRAAYEFAKDLPYNKMIAAVAAISVLLSSERKRLPGGTLQWMLFAFFGWVTLATLFADDRAYSLDFYISRIVPIILFLLLALVVVNSALRLHALVWVYCLALGWHAVKLGLVTILERGDIGSFRDFGPTGTMIADRNHFAIALIMCAPLLYYLYRQSERRWLRIACVVVLAFDLIAVLGTHSRGGFATLLIIGGYAWLQTKHKLISGSVLAVLGVLALFALPESFKERMTTIAQQFERTESWQEREYDLSFEQRMMAWCMGYQIAEESPLLGGGPRVVQHPATPERPGLEDCPLYGTKWWMPRAAHSVYFEIMSDAGFVGLSLFIGLAVVGWLTCGRIVAMSRGDPALAWAADLAQVLRVSILAYMAGGGLLSLVYYDGYYILLVMAIVLHRLVADAKRAAQSAQQADGRRARAAAAEGLRPATA